MGIIPLRRWAGLCPVFSAVFYAAGVWAQPHRCRPDNPHQAGYTHRCSDKSLANSGSSRNIDGSNAGKSVIKY